MPMLARSKLWGKGHTTVPNEVRKLLDLKKEITLNGFTKTAGS